MNQKRITQQREKLRKDIIEWNNKFPIDFIWRKKYGVAFGSPEHRQMSFLDMIFDIEEEIFMRNMLTQKRNNNTKTAEGGMSEHDITELFDDIDINDLDKYNIKTP